MNQLILFGNDRSPNPGVELNFKVWNYKRPVTTVGFSEIRNFYFSTNPLYIDKDYSFPHGFSIAFEVAPHSFVRVSILPARFPSESPEEVMSRFSGSAVANILQKGQVIFEGNVDSGFHKITDATILKKLPTGIYQLMLEVDGKQFTRFLYLEGSFDCEEVYPEIRVVMGGCV